METQSVADPPMADEAPSVYVTGDVAIDWNLARTVNGPRQEVALWNLADTAEMHHGLGRAKVVERLLVQRARVDPRSTPNFEVASPFDESWDNAPSPIDPRFHHAFCIWELKDQKSSDPGGTKAWRIAEFFGVNKATEPPPYSLTPDPGGHRVVFLDDAGLSFRSEPQHWPQSLTDPALRAMTPWYLVKVADPILGSPLVKFLADHVAERSIAVVTLEDLRRSKIHVDRDLSWERIGEDLNAAFAAGKLADFAGFRYVVIILGTGGALIWRGPGLDGVRRRPTLVFDPESIEWSWTEKHPGKLIGYATCMAASVAFALTVTPPQSFDDDTLEHAVRSGIGAMRALHYVGYGATNFNETAVKFGFPVEQVAAHLQLKSFPTGSQATGLKSIDLHEPSSADTSFLTTNLRAQGIDLLTLAKDIVKVGVAAADLAGPIGRFDRLLTISRREIEGYRGLQRRLREYHASDSERPFSFTVFGTPGSGKSFGAASVVQCSLPADRVESMVFNLSQFESPAELTNAFHQVRDATLRGRIPFVLWDEFDSPLGSNQYGWLKYFLAPMQDGEFLHGQVRHPLGKAVFAFAGGTAPNRRRLEHPRQVGRQDTALGVDPAIYESAKIPDFLSRAVANIDVLGPNPENDLDSDFLLRRAILLRSILERTRPGLIRVSPETKRPELHIDDGVLHGLLSVDRYKHGARSLEQVVAMSALQGAKVYTMDALPLDAELTSQVESGVGLRDLCLGYGREQDQGIVSGLPPELDGSTPDVLELSHELAGE